jgi:cell division septum initiation protein DivIVA
LLQHLRDENKFLREQIEAHARSEAELRAALRTAISASSHQLTAPGESAVEGSGSPANPPGGSLGGNAASGARKLVERKREPPRPLWQIMLGIRPRK